VANTEKPSTGTAAVDRTGGEEAFRRRANFRMAAILLSVALAFGLGFVAKIWLFGPR
jgi:hypothetical protein